MMNRRDFLKCTAAAGATVVPWRYANATRPTPGLALRLSAKPGTARVRAGAETAVLRFTAAVTHGDPAAVQACGDSYVGPVLRFRQGERVQVRFENRTGEPSIVHWHGMLVPAAMDGHPRSVIPSGHAFDYAFDIANRAGTYWYHPHPHGRTATQIYAGLAGPLLVSDAHERALGLPSGAQERVLVVQDRRLDADNRLRYGGGMMQQMMGFLGDTVLVNGQTDFLLRVTRRPHRLRFLNASNARSYKLAWSDGTPLTVIGTDGGLLERPLTRPYVMLAPAERIELWADFSHYPANHELSLQSLSFDGMPAMGGMMGGMMNGMMGGGTGMAAGTANGAPLSVCRVRVDGPPVKDTQRLPARLVPLDGYALADAVNRTRPRVIRLAMGRMRWTLNGRTFEMDAVARDEIVRAGDLEVWEFVNEGGSSMMGGMMHPMHIHGVQFQVVSREIPREFARAYGTIRDGLVDEGWKDTVLVSPGERVRILVKFADGPGLFVYHCHNLEHADGGMMRNYRVQARR